MNTSTPDFETEFARIKALAENAAPLDTHKKIDSIYLNTFSDADYPELEERLDAYVKSERGQAYMAAKVKEYMAAASTTTPIPAPTTPAPTTPTPTTPTNLLKSAEMLKGCTLTGQNKQQEAVDLVKGTKYVATIDLKSTVGAGPNGFEMVKPDGSGEFYRELKAGKINTIPFTATATESRRFTISANGGTSVFNPSSLTPE